MVAIDHAKLAAICEAHDVVTLRVFGSTARGENDDQSDIDLLVRFRERKGLLELVRIERELASAMGGDVDLVTEGALSPHLRNEVLRTAKVLYEQ